MCELTFENMIPIMKPFEAAKNHLYMELDKMAQTGTITDSEFADWTARLKFNENLIHEAYYLDTKDRNSRETIFTCCAESLIALTEKILYSRNSP